MEQPELDDDDLPDLIQRLRNNDSIAAAQIYRRYGGDLRRIVDDRIEPLLKRRMDADDVLQSAFRTFFRRIRDGQFKVDDSTQLWNLLCAITLTKLREQARFHLRARRDVNREQTPAKPDPRDTQQLDAEPAISSKFVYRAVDFADQLEKLMDTLDEEEFAIVGLKLGEQTNAQIADQLGVSERTVRRLLARLYKRFERELS